MNAPRLPIPNPEDWATRGAAAEALEVDPRTIARLVRANRLHAYHIRASPQEEVRMVFWWPEVQALAAARRVAREGVQQGG